MPPFQEDDLVESHQDWRQLKRLLVYLRPYKRQVALGLALSVLSSLAMVVIPWIVGKAIDWYILPADGSAPNLKGVWEMAGLFLGISLFIFVSDYLNWMIVARVGQEAMRDLRMDIFSHLQTLSLRFFDRTPVGRLITRITSDVETLNQLLSSGIISVIQQVFMLFGLLILLLIINWKLFLISGVVIPVCVAAAWNFRHQVRKHYRETRRRLALLNAFIQENVTGMRTVQAYTREGRQLDRFVNLNHAYREATIKTVFQYAVFFPLVEVLSTAGLAIVVWKGGSQVMRGILTIGELTVFFQALERFFWPIRDLSERYNLLQASIAASERIFLLLDQKPDVPEPKEKRPLMPFEKSIEFRDVWLAYNDENWVLKGVSLTIEKGQTVAIVGPTGSGKTSLINLLCRFYEFQKGDILFDGQSIRALAGDDLRRQIALVLQDVFLFYGDVTTNIRLGEERISGERVREAARRVQADPFIQRLPKGYDSGVKERGATLSVGQKQLLAFARALAFDPQVLILDEATANIDTDTELLIQKALDELLRDRTSLVIAHRLSTIQRADKIVVLHHGKVAEMGTHQELLRLDGLYRRLYDLQYARPAGATPAAADRG